MSPKPMAFNQKRRRIAARNNYPNPGVIDQLTCSNTTTRSCTYVGRRVLLEPEKKGKKVKLHPNEVVQRSTPSPVRINFQVTRQVNKLQKQPQTPKTPQAFDSVSLSKFDSLPMDLLVKILCYLHHDQLQTVSHVCQRFREAVLLARQLYFNYTTPDRSRQAMLRTATAAITEHWSITRANRKGKWESNPRTPKAPRHGPRPPRLHMIDIGQISAVLFQESTFPPRCIPPSRFAKGSL